ncbi:MAG: hypothetical protein EOO15_02680 [Chitinophagaceae bacterium]|nr:MAG: hypothetical protein EOO15_02680 [Chitinophagaceae bacterium]
MKDDRRKELDRKLSKAVRSAFWSEFSWKSYLILSTIPLFLLALFMAAWFRLGPRAGMPPVVGREVSSFSTPQKTLRSQLLMTVKLDDGRTVQVTLPPGTQYVPRGRMELKAFRHEFAWIRSEQYSFGRYLDDLSCPDR